MNNLEINGFDYKLNNLLQKPRSWILTFTDFDDTLYSRTPQFQRDERFLKFRWKDWIKFVYEVLWYENFLTTYYSPEFVVQDVLKRTDVILTAWEKELQMWKLEYAKIDKDAIVVYEHKKKPEAIIDYILNNLSYIPKEIFFIDDKAFDLSEDFKELSLLLDTKIIIENIKLSQKNPKEVEEIKYEKFVSWKKAA